MQGGKQPALRKNPALARTRVLLALMALNHAAPALASAAGTAPLHPAAGMSALTREAAARPIPAEVEGVVALGTAEWGSGVLLGGGSLLFALALIVVLMRSNRALREQIEECRRTEERLVKQRAEYETIIDSVPALVLFKDDQNRHLRINPAGAELLGCRREDIEGHLASDLDPVHADQFHRDDLEVIRSGRPRFGITEVVRAAGRGERWVRTDKIPYRDATGKGTGVIVFSVDITERLLAERALQKAHGELEARVEERTAALKAEVAQRRAAEEEACRARAEAETANKAKSQFLAAMSHEIRTPMNAIIGMTNLLLDTPLSPTQRDFADTVRLSAESLLTIINDILDFSRIEAGKLQMDETDFSLRELVEGVTETLAEAAAAKHVELACAIDAAIPDRLRGDPGRLRQVLLNLTANAVKFTARGEVIVKVHSDAVPEPDRAVAPGRVHLHVGVRDTGPGIAADVQRQLFQPFVQADNSTTRQFGGTGLGLAISRRLVEMMGGRIGVESTPGNGSTFWFTVRLSKSDAHGESVPDPECLAGKRVLIVDDNAANRIILHHQLTAWNVRNGEDAANGPEALTALRRAALARDPFVLALLDMEMPGMDGLNLARAIRSDPRLSQTALVILTSLCHPLSQAEIRSHGIAACLVKPVKQSQLRRTMAEVIGCPPHETPTGSEGTTRMGARHAEAGIAPGRDSVRQLRILVAEDNAVNQKLTRHQLAKLGYQSDVVANGLEVIAAVQQNSYDLVLMDCHMPGLDGYEASRRLRELGMLREQLVIIAMTANAMEGDREKCLAAGMDDYLSKPTSIDKLRSALERAAGQWLAR
jgi:PAS domain S-box-containing protein